MSLSSETETEAERAAVADDIDPDAAVLQVQDALRALGYAADQTPPRHSNATTRNGKKWPTPNWESSKVFNIKIIYLHVFYKVAYHICHILKLDV